MDRRIVASTALPLAAIAMLAAAPAAYAGEWIGDPKTLCRVWNPTPKAGETIAWFGPCKGGLAEGKGVLQWLNGGVPFERDEGEWREGRQTGEGVQIWPSGRYQGELRDGLPNGRGVMSLADGRYEGMLRYGKPDGAGVLQGSGGAFQGIWRAGCFKDGQRRAAFGVALASCP